LTDSSQSALQQLFYDVYRDDPMAHRANRRRVELVLRLLSKIPPGKLLDVGCSDGSLTARFRPFTLYGVDVSPEVVRVASSKGIIATCGDISIGFPFEADSFDVVFAGETIEHTVRTDFFLSECNRVLAPGGFLLITTPSVASVASWFMLGFFDLPPYGSARYRSPHVRDFTKRLLRLALRNNGFTPLETWGTWLGIPWPRPLDALFGPIEAAVARIAPRFSAGLVVRAQKTGVARFDPSTEIQATLDRY
jgi:SAM-dependent methyltransferase